MNWLLKFWCSIQIGPPRYLRVSLDEWSALDPGRAITYSDDKTGREWVVMNRDDLEHAIQVGSMQLVRKPSGSTVTPE